MALKRKSKDVFHDICQVCGCEYLSCTSPMLKEDTWASITDDVDGFMCCDCMEKRLGREITEDDLILWDNSPDPPEHVSWNKHFLKKFKTTKFKLKYDGDQPEGLKLYDQLLSLMLG